MMKKRIWLNVTEYVHLEFDTQAIGFNRWQCSRCGANDGFLRGLIVWDCTAFLVLREPEHCTDGRMLAHNDPIALEATAAMRETLRTTAVCHRCLPAFHAELSAEQTAEGGGA